MGLAAKKMDEQTVVIPFRLPRRLHSLVKQYAESQSAQIRVTQADVLREAVELFFSANRLEKRNDIDQNSDTKGGDGAK